MGGGGQQQSLSSRGRVPAGAGWPGLLPMPGTLRPTWADLNLPVLCPRPLSLSLSPPSNQRSSQCTPNMKASLFRALPCPVLGFLLCLTHSECQPHIQQDLLPHSPQRYSSPAAGSPQQHTPKHIHTPSPLSRRCCPSRMPFPSCLTFQHPALPSGLTTKTSSPQESSQDPEAEITTPCSEP